MYIEIKKVKFKNFMSYQDEVSLEVSEGMVLINGKNGKGKCQTKSTLIDIDFENIETKKLFEEFMNGRSKS